MRISDLLPSSRMSNPPVLDAAVRPAPPRPRHALLVSPFYPKCRHASFGKHVLTPAQSLTSIAAATPPEWTLEFWDENLLQGHPPFDPFPSVVGITVHLTFARRAYELAHWYRAHGARVVLGGLHVTSCPDDAAPHADAVAIGEGVQLWPQILRDAEAGRLKPRYEGSYTVPFRSQRPPRRDILPEGSFLSTASLIATRGCRNRCDFCYLATDRLHMPCQFRDPQAVADEFVATGEPYGVFIDNNLGSDRDYLHKLCRALQPARRIWSAAVTVDVTDDAQLVGEMARSGCTGVFVGLETLNGRNLDDAHKRTPRPDDYAWRVRLFHDNGIQVNGSFVFGFDHDGPDVFHRTVEWIERNRLECATFHILTPYPGTPLFARLEAEGRILHRNWDLYDTSRAVFRPRLMEPGELESGYRWCYRRLFSHRSIWVRRPAEWGEVPGYLAMSYLYKRANLLWPFVIRRRWTRALWHPLVELARRRRMRALGHEGWWTGVQSITLYY